VLDRAHHARRPGGVSTADSRKSPLARARPGRTALALLRALGATRRQVLRALVSEALALALGIDALAAGLPAVRAARADPRECLQFE